MLLPINNSLDFILIYIKKEQTSERLKKMTKQNALINKTFDIN